MAGLFNSAPIVSNCTCLASLHSIEIDRMCEQKVEEEVIIDPFGNWANAKSPYNFHTSIGKMAVSASY